MDCTTLSNHSFALALSLVTLLIIAFAALFYTPLERKQIRIKRVWHGLKKLFTNCKSTTAPHVDSTQSIAQYKTSLPVPVPEGSQAKPVRNELLLEYFPAEIRRHLLSTLEYEGLKTLVHASPVYHQQYLLDRQYLLCRCLETVLGCNFFDACVVFQSGLASFLETRTQEKITQFLDSYRNYRYSPHFLKILTLDEITSIITFHFSIIKPLAWYYTGWAMDNLSKETKNPQNHWPLSITEEARLVRAFYRFQLYCNLFGVSRYPFFQRALRIRPVDFLGLFLNIYEPWEAEDFLCVHMFVTKKFNQVFDDIAWDVHQDNPKFDGQNRPPTPEEAFDFEAISNKEFLLNGTITRGFELLCDVLFKIKNHSHLVSTMQEQITYARSPTMMLTFLPSSQSMRREKYPSDKDLKEIRRDPLPFQGDNEALPPLSWTLTWQETYSNLSGIFIPESIRLWGYTMWDATRIEHTGAKEVLARQWRERWKDTDPRTRI